MKATTCCHQQKKILHIKKAGLLLSRNKLVKRALMLDYTPQCNIDKGKYPVEILQDYIPQHEFLVGLLNSRKENKGLSM